MLWCSTGWREYTRGLQCQIKVCSWRQDNTDECQEQCSASEQVRQPKLYMNHFHAGSVPRNSFWALYHRVRCQRSSCQGRTPPRNFMTVIIIRGLQFHATALSLSRTILSHTYSTRNGCASLIFHIGIKENGLGYISHVNLREKAICPHRKHGRAHKELSATVSIGIPERTGASSAGGRIYWICTKRFDRFAMNTCGHPLATRQSKLTVLSA